ncbi:hypothetical protein COCSADRAFT_96812, partial [Bipolaris sorokiniana ND90Pr]
LKIRKFNFTNLYKDRCLCLLNTPSHTIRHISALTRTTVKPLTFIFIGRDIAHHGVKFQLTKYIPLLTKIYPHLFKHGFSHVQPKCPSEVSLSIHPQKGSH